MCGNEAGMHNIKASKGRGRGNTKLSNVAGITYILGRAKEKQVVMPPTLLEAPIFSLCMLT